MFGLSHDYCPMHLKAFGEKQTTIVTSIEKG
jgi:hypothetical protein